MWNYWVCSADQGSDFSSTLKNDLDRLKKATSHSRILKITLFVECKNLQEYDQTLYIFKKIVEQIFDHTPVYNIIPQKPVEKSYVIEAWHTSIPYSNGHFQSKELFQSYYLKGNHDLVVFSAASFTGDVKVDSQNCFNALLNCMTDNNLEFYQLFRQWNYIGDITGISISNDNHQNYQLFNDERGKHFTNTNFNDGFPAATGIGMDIPGVIIESCFVRSKDIQLISLKNPVQKDAHQYSKEVLVLQNCNIGCSTPKFERGKILINKDIRTIYVSGTAAIVGESSTADFTLEEQTEKTLSIIKKLISNENIKNYVSGISFEKYSFHHARVYLKNGLISINLRNLLSEFFDLDSIIFLKAEVCREKLLVEIEAEMKC